MSVFFRGAHAHSTVLFSRRSRMRGQVGVHVEGLGGCSETYREGNRIPFHTRILFHFHAHNTQKQASKNIVSSQCLRQTPVANPMLADGREQHAHLQELKYKLR